MSDRRQYIERRVKWPKPNTLKELLTGTLPPRRVDHERGIGLLHASIQPGTDLSGLDLSVCAISSGRCGHRRRKYEHRRTISV